MSELMAGDETLFSLWSDQQITARPNAVELPFKDPDLPVPIVLLDDGRVVLKSETGQLCLLDGLQGDDILTHLPSVGLLEDTAVELPTLSDATFKSIFVQSDVETEPPLGTPSHGPPEDRAMSDLVCGGLPDLATKPMEDISNLTESMDSLANYNCQYCAFSTSEIHTLIHHFKTGHSDVFQQEFTNETQIRLINATDQETEISSNAGLPQQWPEEPEVNVIETMVFLCSECKGSFKSLDECREHMIKDHNMVILNNVEGDEDLVEDEEEVLPSNIVESVPPSTPPPPAPAPLPPPPPPPPPLAVIKVLKKRRQQKHKEYDPEFEAKPHKCSEPFCVRKFQTVSSLAKHVECHLTEDSSKFCCPNCSMLFHKWGQCAIHLWKEHKIDVDLFTCKVCNEYRTTTLKKLESHSRIHSDERPFKCSECGKGFKQRTQMINHTASVHRDKASGHKWFMTQKCEICLKWYADSKCLKNHIKTVHSKLKPYKCHICGHMSALKVMLQAHMRQHTGEKPFACQLCSFRTGDHNSLRRHVMRHTGNRPYRCPHCKYSCIQSSSFKAHLLNRHPGQSGAYVCLQCYFATVSEKSYQEHMSDHRLNLIPPREVEVFPENVAAAHLVYRSFGASPSNIHCDVTASSTSLDGMKQTITISIPPGDNGVTDDEDTSPYVLGNVLDTGGITIPADPEPESCQV